MGTSEPDDRTVTTDGVTVEKSIDTGADRSATVTLEVASAREAPVTVRVTEGALTAVSPDDIGFHSEYGAECWRVADETMVFERELAAGESYTTIYRAKDLDETGLEAVAAEPEVAIVDAGERAVAPGGTAGEDVEAALDGMVTRGDSDSVRRVIDGETDRIPPEEPPTAETAGPATADSEAPAASVSLDVDEPETDERDGDEPDVDEPAVGSAADEPAAETDESDPSAESADDATAGAAGPGASGGVTRVLLKELREGYVDDQTVRELREELQPSEPNAIRIKHLQNQVSDLAAYVDALDSFVESYGTLEEVVDGIEAELTALDEDISALGDGMATLEDRLSDDIAEVHHDLGSLEDRMAGEIADLETTVASLDDGQAALDDRVSSLERDLDEVRSGLREMESFRERLSSVLQDAEPSSGATDGET